MWILLGREDYVDEAVKHIRITGTLTVDQLMQQFKNSGSFGAGRLATAETIERALPVLLDECHPRTSAHRSTSEYRREMLSVLLRRTVGTAITRAMA